MKKLTIGAIVSAVLLSASYSNAGTPSKTKWSVNDVGISVIIEQNSWDKFAAVAKCSGEGILFLYDLENYNESGIGNSINIKVRVDRNDIKTTTGTLTKDDGLVALLIDDNNEMTPQMKRGDYLRVAFRNNSNQEYTIIEKYSLSGFTSAFNQSKDLCAEQVMEYFPDDGDFF